MALGLSREGLKGINYKNEILAGLTVAIALVPEAIAFSFIAGVSALVGLYAAFIMGFVTATFGGRPAMISGATGAIAILFKDLNTIIPAAFEHISPTDTDQIMTTKLNIIFLAIIFGGLIQVGVGALKLGKFIRLIPFPVMLGFVNGLAIVIFKAQFSQFKDGVGEDASYLSGNSLYIMIGLTLLTMAIMYLLPKLTKAVPSGLVAIVVVGCSVYFFGIDTQLVVNKSSVQGGLPTFHLPDFGIDMTTWNIVWPLGLKVAAVGLIESLLTLSLIDDMTETRGSGNRESIAQGMGNIICGFFGAMGGCAMIGQSMINIKSDARKRLSGIVASISLLLFIIVLYPVINQVPIAALVGIMFMVAIGTFEWSSLRTFNKMPVFDVLIIVVVTVVTIFEDLSIAVVLGVILSAISFAWNQAVRIRARKHIDNNGVKHYDIYGPLFFASTKEFSDKFDPKNDPEHIAVDFAESRVVDMSAIEAIKDIHKKYTDLDKKLTFFNLSNDCVDLLANANVEVNVGESTKDNYYKVVFNA